MSQGRIVALGTPARLKADYPFRLFELKAEGKQLKHILADCPLIDVNAFGDRYHLVAESPEVRPKVEAALQAAGITRFSLHEISPSLEDIFVHLAEGGAS